MLQKLTMAIILLIATSCGKKYQHETPGDNPFDRYFHVLMMGDSMTNRVSYYTSWTQITNHVPVFKIAYDGITTDGLLNLWGGNSPINQAISQNPDIVYLMAGINDAHQSVNINTTMSNWRALCDSFDTHGIQVVVESPLPVTPEYNQMIGGNVIAQRAKVLRDSLINLANDRNYEFLDLWQTALVYDSAGVTWLDRTLSTDGIHLNEAGYNVWAAPLSQSITNNQ